MFVTHLSRDFLCLFVTHQVLDVVVVTVVFRQLLLHHHCGKFSYAIADLVLSDYRLMRYSLSVIVCVKKYSINHIRGRTNKTNNLKFLSSGALEKFALIGH